ncbi:MAG: DUF2157 domain-containing protein [Bacteroidetes bacterium]|nr:DUF2157 domain-containing protein [Bacteroidota bacterium]
MPKSPIKELVIADLVKPELLQHIEACEKTRPGSIYTPVSMLLYTGSSAVLGAVSILIYKHFEQIGHLALLIALFSMCLMGLFICFVKRTKYETTLWYDYLLSSSAVLLSIAVAYMQYQFGVFGNLHWMAFLVPAFFQAILAYYFDDVAVLCIAISNVAASIGIKFVLVTGYLLFPFQHEAVFYSAIALGLGLFVTGYFHHRKLFFAHFSFSYYTFGFHLVSISLIALSNLSLHLLWFLILLAVLYFSFRLALQLKSFVMYVFVVLYAYAGTTFIIVNTTGFGSGYFAMIYFIATAIMAIKYIRHYRHKFDIK